MDQQQEALQQLLALMDASRGAPRAGMAGTPGGPVQESPTMRAERMMQMAPSRASAGVGMYGAGTFNPALAAGGGLGYLLTQPMHENAQEPNIRDVWADKLRMMTQGN